MKIRVLSAIVLLAIFIPILVIGGLPFALAAGVVGLLAYKEVIDLKKHENELPSIIKLLGAISLLFLIYASSNEYFMDLRISYKSIALLLIVYLLPTLFNGKDGNYTTKDAFYLIGWTLLLGIFFNALIVIVNYNTLYLIYLLLITTLNDAFALIFGRLIGAHKLTSISPNKTVEGSICGLILGSFVAVVFYINILNPAISLLKIIVITIILSIVGQCGDLIFSKIKREHHVKDFSHLIPGHGGILDRFDSLLFVVLVYIIIINII